LASFFRPVTENFSYTTRTGMAAGLKRVGGWGFLPRKVSDEENFFVSLNLSGLVVYDVGSYEGIFSLFAARAVGASGKLIVFEPNPQCFARTERNLAINNFPCSITMRNVAAGSEAGSATMWSNPSELARSTLDHAIADLNVTEGNKLVEISVPVVAIDDEVSAGLQPPNFVKIDTEGFEFPVLQGARETLTRYGPDLFIELHGTTRDHWITNRRDVQQLLEGCGYSIFDMYRRPLGEDQGASHLYCTKPAH
jgi:FkbM family methyltransferase